MNQRTKKFMYELRDQGTFGTSSSREHSKMFTKYMRASYQREQGNNERPYSTIILMSHPVIRQRSVMIKSERSQF